jgi:hypothetical protein
MGCMAAGDGEQREAATAVVTSGCFPRSSIIDCDEQPMNEHVSEDDESVN